MPNGRPRDNPLTDLTVYGVRPFPPDIEALLLRVDALGRRPGRWPLGENWPFSPREFSWEQGENLDEARALLTNLIELLEAGRGDEVLLDPRTGKAFIVASSQSSGDTQPWAALPLEEPDDRASDEHDREGEDGDPDDLPDGGASGRRSEPLA